MSLAPGMEIASFFDNVGGLNITDSPFKVQPTQATGGTNYEYTQTGAIRKRNGHQKLNTSAYTDLLTRGLGARISATGSKDVIRSAGQRLQALNSTLTGVTDLSEDTLTASTTPWSSSNSAQTVFSAFNTPTVNVLWCAGGASSVYGIYSNTKFTSNGVPTPGGTFSAAVSAPGTGVFAAAGSYRYAVVLRKASTQAVSNAYLSVQATIANTTDNVTLNFAGLTGIDTTKYDQIQVYRSALNGVADFTTGDLIAQLASNVTSYVDTGTRILASQNVPRPGNTILDNSVLPAGTVNALTTWKRRLVAAVGQSIYISDLNKPESWPTANVITVPTGGPITGLAVISFNTDFGNDEYLAVFQERQLWLIRGDSVSDWTLSFIDSVGCPNQSLIVTANGYLTWIDYRGVYLWDGSNKPIYASRPIERLFGLDGDLAKANLNLGCGAFFRKNNQVVWFVSHKIYGTQKAAIKMDLRLTLPRVETTLSGRILDGVFMIDSLVDQAIYAMASYLPENGFEERLLLGDNTGFVYGGYELFSDGGTAIDFSYVSRYLEMGEPNLSKRYHKVIVWVEEIGNWDLCLDYWAGYRAALTERSTLCRPISTADGAPVSLWDIALWDVASWDQYVQRLVPLTFNLSSDRNNNNEGDALLLRFTQTGVDQPVTIHGFSVVYSTKGITK